MIIHRHWLDHSVEIHFKAIKSLRMKINDQDGSIRISAPKQLPESTVFEFMQQNYQWIEQRQQELAKRPNIIYQSGEQHYLWGTPYALEVIVGNIRPSIKLMDPQSIELRIPENYTVPQKEKLLDNLYRKQIKHVIPDLLEKWQPIVDREVNDWGVKKMRTRWGTCNIQAKRIWLSLELAKKPKECLEYVMVHELVHLHERNHNKRFYELMTLFMPDWKAYEGLLKQGNQAVEL